MTTTEQQAPSRAPRQDGQATRQQILEIAGQVFAERGFANATSKEICARSQANVAAVNYHFEGKDGLYTAVLLEAHQRIMTLETLEALTASELSGEDKLRRLITELLASLGSPRLAWPAKVLARELLSPSPLLPAVLKKESFPKARATRRIIGELLNLPEDDPAVLRSALNIFSPCLFLLIAHDSLSITVLPGLDTEPQPLLEHMLVYALGGLAAIGEHHRKATTP